MLSTATLSLVGFCFIGDPGGRITLSAAPVRPVDHSCVRQAVVSAGYQGVGSLRDSGVALQLPMEEQDQRGALWVSIFPVANATGSGLALRHSWIGPPPSGVQELEIQRRLHGLLDFLTSPTTWLTRSGFLDQTDAISATSAGKVRAQASLGICYALAWLSGDLAAMDPRNARIAVLSRHGEWRDDIRHFPITGPASLIRLHPLGGEAFYAPVIDMDRQALPFVRFSTTGAKDTIPAPSIPPGERLTGVVCHRPDGGITGISMPESPGIVYAFPPPGGTVAVSWTQQYRIVFFDSHGDTVRVTTRERAAAPYTEELWEAGMRPYRELLENFPGVRCEPTAPERPQYRAALRHILFDETGQMWVEAAVEEGFAWEVFSAEGRLLGLAPAPSRAPAIPPYVRNGHLYQVETDEMDVQYVAVYRVHAQG
jgi:hypothetical protein